MIKNSLCFFWLGLIFNLLIAFDPAHAQVWCGRAPLCDGSCKDGENALKSDKSGGGHACWTGHKVLCTTIHTQDPCTPGPLDFFVDSDYYGCWENASNCAANTDQVMVVIHTDALKKGMQPSPAQPTAITWQSMSSGDCVMQNANVTFKPDGTAIFAAQVKTNHTHSGDIWHATIATKDNEGKILFTSPKMDSGRMDDNHPWYQWRAIYPFDFRLFGKIHDATMDHSC